MAIQKDATSEITRWTAVVSDAATTFHRRWTDLALRRVDGALARLLHEQIGLFDQACVTGSADEIGVQGAATCRGYAAAVRAMEAAGPNGGPYPDDAYQLGHDPQTGTRVAIGNHKGVTDRVQELHQGDVICITPDEVAVMIASLESMKGIAEVKRFFPGAEIVRKYQERGN
jgi:hypothetical protein